MSRRMSPATSDLIVVEPCSLTCLNHTVLLVRAVDAIFQALCEGALANPDPDAEEDEGDFFYDEVSVSGCASNDRAHHITILPAHVHTSCKRHQ
jgi:Regulator of volume decrease after cellular swelling